MRVPPHSSNPAASSGAGGGDPYRERKSGPEAEAEWLKVDLHIHTAEDPLDELDYSASELLHRAHALGFHAVAITHHDAVFLRPEVTALACELGVHLIPAGEIRIEGADVLVLNISPEEAAALRSWDDLAALRRQRGEEILVIAAHPFFLLGGSMGGACLQEKMALFDAIELCHLHTRLVDFNAPAVALARACGKPLVATSDTHRLSHFGRHYTRVKAPAGSGEGGVRALFAAIRAGKVECISPPHSLWGFLEYAWWIFAVHETRVMQARCCGQALRPAWNGESLVTPRLPEGRAL